MKCTGAKKLIPKQRNNFDNPNQGRDMVFERLLNIIQVFEDLNIARGDNDNDAPVEADEGALKELQDMGFPEDRARQALINSHNDINRATEILLGEGGD